MIDHLADDVLVGLALDDLDPPLRADALEHLRACGTCRASYDGTRLAVEAVLPATPVLEPSPGFDERVLAAMGLAAPKPPSEAGPSPEAPVARLDERRPRRVWLLPAAAALVVGMALGAGATWYAARDDVPAAAPASTGTPLAKEDGSVVGEVSGAWAEGEPVVVIAVSDAPAGARYTCRVRLADSDEPVDVGSWTLADGSGTWVVPGLDVADVVAVEMVREDGTVWATADL